MARRAAARMRFLQRRTVVVIALAGLLLAALAGLAVIAAERVALGPTDGAGWRPVAWPLPRDVWPDGRAWRQRDGTEVLVRVKPGLCGDCESGPTADEELERASDLDRVDPGFAPLAAGQRVRITDLFGRARLYRRRTALGGERLAEAIAVSYRCDLVVALVLGDGLDDAATRRRAHRFLESNTVQVWLNRQLDGGHAGR